MELNREMYEKAKTAVTGTGGLSHAMDAYAQAYFSVPPITGEWTVEAMREELSMLLWDYHNGCIDLRRRSAETILGDRFQSAKVLLEKAEANWKLASEERGKMHTFIIRFHLEKLYEEHLKDARSGASGLYPPYEELPFI